MTGTVNRSGGTGSLEKPWSSPPFPRMPLFLRNPHSVLAVLETRPQDILEIHLPSSQVQKTWSQVRSSALDIGLRVNETPEGGHRTNPGRSGSASARVKPRRPIPLEHLFSSISEGRLWLALDGVQDPQNLGSIFRTAAFFGLQGMLLTRRRSAPLSETVYDVASGGIEHVPFCVETNLSQALDYAKERGLWILGTSERAKSDLSTIERDRPWLLLLGSEDRGLRRLSEEKCDAVCRIPSMGGVGSLNVSVAATIFIHELSR